jgi:choline dehydrogenase-like flavoprotein
LAIIQANELPEGSEISADLCIAGAGAAGITLAMEFADSRTRVCLLESGGRKPDHRTQALYDLESVGYPMRQDFISRARQFGGSCNLWAGRNMRMSPIDFEQRDWIPNSGWPLKYRELEPYYERAEAILGIPGHRRFASVDAIPDIDGGEKKLLAAKDVVPTVALWGTRPMRFAKVHGTTLRRSRNVDVYLNANVTELVPAEGGRAIDHLVLRTLDGRTVHVRAQSYVLACGGLENARLLLVSRRRHDRGVGNEHDVVGRYFLEHPRALHGRIRVNPGVRLPYLTGIPLADGKVQLGVALSEQAQREARVPNSYVSFEPTMSDAAARNYGRSMNVAKVIVRRGYDDAGGKAQAERANVRELIYLLTPKEVMPHWLYRPYALLKRKARGRRSIGHLTVINFCEQVPDRASRATLSEQRDALGMNKLRLDWRVGAAERRSVELLHGVIARHVEEFGIGTMEVSAREAGELHFTDASHHMGTTRMSEDVTTGVVDRDCRVHGLDNLYMAGSSVFATGGHANPTLTIVALTLRLAEHLKAVEQRTRAGSSVHS